MVIVALALLSCAEAQLKIGFYDETCPKAEKLVSDFIKKHIPNAPSLAGPLLRMQFHDCFVRVSYPSFLRQDPRRRSTVSYSFN